MAEIPEIIGYPLHPDLVPGLPPKDKVKNDTDRDGGAREWKITLSARGEVVPIIYGRAQVGALVFAVGESTDYLYIGCIWAVGECNSVSEIYIDGKSISSELGYSYHSYTGTTTQTADSWLSSYVGDGTVYSDDLIADINGEKAGICYSVLQLPKDFSFNRIWATIEGRKVHIPGKVYSNWTEARIEKEDGILLPELDGGNLNNIFVHTSGTRAWISNSSTDRIYELAFEVPFELNTIKATGRTFDHSSETTNSDVLFFSSDGTKMYLNQAYGNSNVFEYVLSTAWDITTASLNHTYTGLQSTNYSAQGLCFSSDGKTMYEASSQDAKIFIHNLTTAWDLSTASYSGTSYSTAIVNCSSIAFSSNGLNFYASNVSDIRHYSLSTAWDLSSATVDTDLDTAGGCRGIFLHPDEFFLYYSSDTTSKLYRWRVAKTYTETPVGALIDLITDRALGMGRYVDWLSTYYAYWFNKETVGSGERKNIGIVLPKPNQIINHIRDIQRYAGVYLDFSGPNVYFTKDWKVNPSDYVAHFDGSDGDVLDGKLFFRKAKTSSLPTVIRLSYTNRYDSTGAEKADWTTADVIVKNPKVDTGELPWKEAHLSYPGINVTAQAQREAVEYYNHLYNEDMAVDITAFDEAIGVSVGDVTTVTSDFSGIVDKPFRVIKIQMVSLGRWRITGKEYQENTYSDDLADEPDIVDTVLSDPSDVPAPTGLSSSEYTFRDVRGKFSTLFNATWNAVSYPYEYQYEYYVLYTESGASKEIIRATTYTESFATPPLHLAGEYTYYVRTVGVNNGFISSWASATIDIQGKGYVPGPVQDFSGFEVGGEVRLSWRPPANPTAPSEYDPDIEYYEIRYGAEDVTWANATLLDRPLTLRLVTKELGEGTYDFLIKAVDTIGQYSSSEQRLTITVTLDNNAYLAASDWMDYGGDAGALDYSLAFPCTHKVAVINNEYEWRYLIIPNYSTDSVSTIFSSTDIDTNYPNKALTYVGSATGNWSFIPDSSLDATASTGGTWTVIKKNASYQPKTVTGTVTEVLQLSDDGSTWTDYSDLSVKQTARYARYKVSGDETNLAYMIVPEIDINVNVVPRTENGVGTTDATNGRFQVTLNQEYTKVVGITLTAERTSAVTLVTDSIVVGEGTTNSFYVYAFDSSGTKISGLDVYWKFDGVG